MTGKPGQSSVVYLREAHQRSVSDWIRQLLPPGWQFRQQNAAIPALNKRHPVWSVNDQWHRALNALLAGQQLYGHMDWNRENTDCHDLCNTADRRHGTAGFTESC